MTKISTSPAKANPEVFLPTLQQPNNSDHTTEERAHDADARDIAARARRSSVRGGGAAAGRAAGATTARLRGLEQRRRARDVAADGLRHGRQPGRREDAAAAAAAGPGRRLRHDGSHRCCPCAPRPAVAPVAPAVPCSLESVSGVFISLKTVEE